MRCTTKSMAKHFLNRETSIPRISRLDLRLNSCLEGIALATSTPGLMPCPLNEEHQTADANVVQNCNRSLSMRAKRYKKVIK